VIADRSGWPAIFPWIQSTGIQAGAAGDYIAESLPVKVEHFALQVSAPAAMADWYVKHLGCSIARSEGEPTHGRFLLDDASSVMLEIYRNPRVPVPDYNALDELLVHLAFLSDQPAADRDRLVAAGARVTQELVRTPAGDQTVMLRDPWGLALQLIKRAEPMLRP
jgi:uncharacterized glyoxalase superfamily protein PhnB